MAHDIVIDVDSLTKTYKKAKTNAVDTISFSVNEGELFAFLGPNGAGKTTTISILTTTLSKTSGSVRIAGFDLDKSTKKVRQNVGIIFQNPSLDLGLTAEQNIRFHVCLYGLYAYRPTYRMMPKEYRKRVEELAAVVGIGDDIFKKLGSFSGGMKRKLEIVRSLMHRPKIMFLDEPTTGLDPVSRRSVWEYLRKVQQETNTTIFLTTHYLEEAEGADRVCVINKGKIILNATPAEMKHRLTHRSLIIGSKEPAKLRAELQTLGVSFKEDQVFTIRLDNAVPQKLISSLKTPLNVLQIHEPSLEEAYISTLSSEEGNQLHA